MATEHDTRTAEQHAALGAALLDIMKDTPSAPAAVFADGPRQTETPAPTLPRLHQHETEYETPHDLLTMRLAQAASLSRLLFGGGLESFLEVADDHKDNILWALSSLIHDAQIAASRLPRGGN